MLEKIPRNEEKVKQTQIRLDKLCPSQVGF